MHGNDGHVSTFSEKKSLNRADCSHVIETSHSNNEYWIFTNVIQTTSLITNAHGKECSVGSPWKAILDWSTQSTKSSLSRPFTKGTNVLTQFHNEVSNSMVSMLLEILLPVNKDQATPYPLTCECGVIVASISCIQSGWNSLPLLFIRIILMEVTIWGIRLEVTKHWVDLCREIVLFNLVSG